MAEEKKEETLAEGTLMSHLLELRDRLLKAVLTLFIVFIPCAMFANELFMWVAQPLVDKLPAGSTLQSTSVVGPFMTPFKVSFYVALFASMPMVLYQIWAFVAPGLYKREKRFAVPLLLSSVLLFYAGVVFAYFVVFPVMFKFFTSVAPQGVTVMTDINSYLDFILALFFAFGAAFEVPVATVLLCWVGFTTPAKLASHRGYVLIGAFVVGAVLTPPDVFSQTLLAVPMYLLYEAGIIMARILAPGSSDVEAQEEA